MLDGSCDHDKLARLHVGAHGNGELGKPERWLETAREMPVIEIHHLETLTEASVTSAKGLGEGGAIGAPAAVVNAINDALSPFGVSIDEFPATPQRVRAALRAARGQA